MMPVENDCEDQGYTRIEDGCYVCAPSFDHQGKPVRVKFEQKDIRGKKYWVCPKCHGNYGEVREPVSPKEVPPGGNPADEHPGDYGTGAALPSIHPDRATDMEIMVSALCGNLDVLRRTLRFVINQGPSPAVLDQCRWALSETDCRRLVE